MDGSRLANACASLGVGMRELSRDCGIDILSLGGTKNGMMMGEVVISFRPELNDSLRFIRKQSAQLYSKMRFHTAQFLAYFADDLWLQNARHANNMATYLAERINGFPGIQITQAVDSNAIFLILPEKVIEKLSKEFFFYTWNEERHEVRWVCSWDTTEEDISHLVEQLKTAIFAG
jgi:threonine aldolase